MSIEKLKEDTIRAFRDPINGRINGNEFRIEIIGNKLNEIIEVVNRLEEEKQDKIIINTQV